MSRGLSRSGAPSTFHYLCRYTQPHHKTVHRLVIDGSYHESYHFTWGQVIIVSLTGGKGDTHSTIHLSVMVSSTTQDTVFGRHQDLKGFGGSLHPKHLDPYALGDTTLIPPEMW